MNKIKSRVLNLTGQRFGKGTVLQQVATPEHVKRNGRYWQVQCDCGSICVVDGSSLKRRWKSCGCIHEENLVGKRFNNGIVKSLRKRRGGYRIWELECDCGRTYFSPTQSLTSNNTKSCGCLNNRKGKKHPLYKGHEDLSGDYWSKLKKGAKTRNINFEISIELAWELFIKQNKKCALTDWEITILSHDIWAQTASLDRIDSKNGYIEGNVQWVHKDVNKMKWDYPQEYFVKLCKAIAERSSY
jgi:hypothetical protein